ncbi:hypothetical protein CDEF62S_05274 [Castellaniella defragrans]
MNAKTILAASFAALAISAGAPGVAATAAQGNSSGSGMMQQGASSSQSSSTMKGAATPDAAGGSMMEGAGSQGAMGGGMMGMMGMMGGGCPMAMGAGLDRKTAMKMHGEMMRAMGDILIKYADKVQEPAVKQ